MRIDRDVGMAGEQVLSNWEKSGAAKILQDSGQLSIIKNYLVQKARSTDVKKL